MDSEDYLSRDLSWAAFNTLEHLKTGWKQGAAASIRREIETENDKLQGFVPFLNERNKLGKLLRRKEVKSTTEELENSIIDDSQGEEADFVAPMSTSLLQRRLPKLGKVVIKSTAPAVGTYNFPSSFKTHSFSTRKTHPTFPPPSKVEKKTMLAHHSSVEKLVPIYQYTIKKKVRTVRVPDKYDILRPEILLEKTRRTNFQLVKLEDSPDEISSSVQILERRQLKDEHLASAKRLMQKLLKSRFT